MGTATSPNKPYGQLVRELLAKYPVRNQHWMYHPETDAFTTDASMMDHSGRLDPWDRPLPASAEAHRDRESEVTHWTLVTTVAGTHIELTIYNT